MSQGVYGFVSGGASTCILLLDLLDNPLVLHACQDGVEISHGGRAELLPWENVMALRDFLNSAWEERP